MIEPLAHMDFDANAFFDSLMQEQQSQDEHGVL